MRGGFKASDVVTAYQYQPIEAERCTLDDYDGMGWDGLTLGLKYDVISGSMKRSHRRLCLLCTCKSCSFSLAQTVSTHSHCVEKKILHFVVHRWSQEVGSKKNHDS